jgi:surface protein
VNLTASFVVSSGISSPDTIVIDWGDGTETNSPSSTVFNQSTHTYSSPGQKTVKIRSNSNKIRINCDTDLIDVQQWGTNQFFSAGGMFGICRKFNSITATDQPDFSICTDMSYMFSQSSTFNQPIGHWYTGNVTSMDNMFNNAVAFNQDIGNWDVSKVTNMATMFNAANAFNKPIGNWNVGNVTNMYAMFSNARVFNQPLNNWNTINVTNMAGMFGDARAFNQPLNNWNTSNVIYMDGMFSVAFGVPSAFNQPIGNWNVSKVISMNDMFGYATSFNQNLSNWITGLTAQPTGFSGGANPTWVASKATTFPFLANGVTRINT